MKHGLKFLAALSIFSISYSCNSTNKDQHVVTENEELGDTANVLTERDPYNQRLVNKFLDKAMREGDTIAYDEVFSYHVGRNMNDWFLYYSLEMANRYHYPKAYLDVYFILSRPYDGRSLSELDVETRNMALYYLLKSSEMGYESAMDEAKTVFKDEAIPKSTFYKRNGDS